MPDEVASADRAATSAATHALALIAISLSLALWPAAAAAVQCPPDSVGVGPLCVDKYEASVWKIKSDDTALIAAVRAGAITSAAQLPAAGRRGVADDDYDPGCVDNAAECRNFYAVSIPGVKPSRFLTWFQAQAICFNSGKRLLTNAE